MDRLLGVVISVAVIGTSLTFGFIAGNDATQSEKSNATDPLVEREHQLQRETLRERLWDSRPILSPPVDPPPSPVRVGPYLYEIRYTSRQALSDQGYLAEVRYEEREIWLDPGRRDNMQVDLLHELLHVAHNLGSDGDKLKSGFEEEENIVATTAMGLEVILQDNPKLVTWLSTKPTKNYRQLEETKGVTP